MSKKRERIERLLGIRNALKTGGKYYFSKEPSIVYQEKFIEQVIADIEELLNMEGITGIPADSIVGSV